MQRVSIIAVLHKLVGYVLSFDSGPAEDNSVHVGIEIGDPLQGQISIFCMYRVADMTDVLGTGIPRAYGDLLGVMHVVPGYGRHLPWHGRGEEQCLSRIWHLLKDGLKIFLKAHVQHLISLIEHDMLHILEINQLASNEIMNTARRGYYYLHTFPDGPYLSIYWRATVNG